MRFSIRVIIATALWIGPTFGQTSTAPSSTTLDKARETIGRFHLIQPQEFSKPVELGTGLCANAYP